MISFDLKQKQTLNIVMITFWSQFSSYAFNAILILFLTRSMLNHGLGYSQEKAYAFMGISSATGYLMPILGGFVADRLLGLRRSILLGGILLAVAYLLILLSSYTIPTYGDKIFLFAYALTPAISSLLIGTASGLVSQIYSQDAAQAKAAMTFYYMAINVGALLSIFIAPSLFESQYGPLSVLAVAFIGKAIAAINFAYRYPLYDNIIQNLDKKPLSLKSWSYIFAYLIGIYLFTLGAYSWITAFSLIISIGSITCMGWFIHRTFYLTGENRFKQLVACVLIFEAIVFFVIYNQMNSTLILFAQSNSDMQFLGFKISPAQYQLLNPLLIIIIGAQLPKFYKAFPRFSIPYQFATGTCIAGLGLFILAICPSYSGLVNGNMIALTYIFITIAELFVSAIGLSMIGLYCDNKTLGFAMGAWYLGSSLSNIVSGQVARYVAIPNTLSDPQQSIQIYQHFYFKMGLTSFALGATMFLLAFYLHHKTKKSQVVLS